MNDVYQRGPQPEASVAVLRQRIKLLEGEVTSLRDALVAESADRDAWKARAEAAEAALEQLRGLPEKWRWEVKLMCTEIGQTVKHAVETRADELAAACELSAKSGDDSPEVAD